VGYERLGRTVPKSVVAGRLSPVQARRRLLRQVLYGLGISEAMPNPFLAPGDLDRAGLDARGLTISNPLVAEESVLRTSLRPGLFKALAYNASHRYDDVALFEVGHTYVPAEGPLPDEREVLGVALAGREGPAVVPVLHEVVAALGLGERMRLAAGEVDATGSLAGMHPGRSSVVTVDGQPVGVVGEVDPGVLEAYGISGRVAWLELDLTIILNLEPAIPQWKPVSRYPSSDIDLAFIVDDEVTADDLRTAIAGAAGSLLIDVELFDVYRGPGIPAAHRSLAFRIRLQAADHTLTDAEVATVREAIIAVAAEKGATLRA